ncbi:acetylornithine deacetylase [Legionella micdadei]|uniref:Acetylornithine deacetylase n=1 Tax=Legionella micdadei TaxID=451 RepID=A0A098GIF4_LEGMI|nr:acetylornithine deacetylase [Legionella micdadei]ARG98670.1 acetylornithine deacetylase [Legionella micdadei]ARH01384.1 acetylornithine deacetylase [Legionella micdadei]KTD28878.1 acetylornithine deacetylase [Legionella micdadei]NSL17090.1 acetylornithine deacetylase [Legionella micdadei]CEG62258.1 Acetylornithine deacetylase [Legionella micdadei]
MNAHQWLAQLIGFNTVSSNSNMELIETIAEWFKLHQIKSHVIRSPTAPKANLFATIPAKNGQTQGGLLLSGHTDVVPVAGQMWTTDPFVAIKHDGKIYGRGASDMKGFIAVLLALLPEFKTLKLAKPLHFAFTYDEEVGCIGVDFLLEYLQEIGIQPEACIVGEPSNMRPIIGEKSRRLFHCQVQGYSVHSSLADEGCNAINYAGRLICYISELAQYIKEHGPFDDDFDVPYSTLSTNIISGGIARNVIPGNCELIIEIRYLPQFPIENLRNQLENYINNELVPEMKKSYPEAAIYLDQISDAPGLITSKDSPIARLMHTVMGTEEYSKVSYSSESASYQEAGISTIICGPGSIEQAHRPDEFISLEQLKICEHALKNIVMLFCMDTH